LRGRSKKKDSLSAAAEIPVLDADWPQWQGPNRDNLSTETGLLTQWPDEGPQMLWSAEGIGEGYSSVAIADRKIYTTGMIEEQGILTCLDLKGKQLWQSNYGPEWKRSFPGTRCTPTVKKGFVYVISGTGQVACFTAGTGDKHWQVDAFGKFQGRYSHWGFSESPLVFDDKIMMFIGGEETLAVALNVKDGSVAWTVPANGDKAAYCSPMAFKWRGKKIIAATTDNHLIGLDSETGKVRWTVPHSAYLQGKNPGVYPNTPIVSDGRIFYSAGYGSGAVQLKLSADGSSVEKVWTNLEFDNHHGSIVLLDGFLYGSNWDGNKNGQWMCVDWATGKTLYQHQWGKKGSLTCAEGMLYCYEESEGVVGLVKATPDGFTPISTFKIALGEKEHWSHPVIFGKRLYMRHGDVIMAFDIAGQS
jgi:outer membrane protein assembly factor BamB